MPYVRGLRLVLLLGALAMGGLTGTFAQGVPAQGTPAQETPAQGTPAASAPMPLIETNETVRVLVGQARVVRLSENPSTGYTWRIDPAASSNIGIVRITDRGFIRHLRFGNRVGAPGIHGFRFTGLAPGTARVTLLSVRPSDPANPARRHVLTIEVTPR